MSSETLSVLLWPKVAEPCTGRSLPIEQWKWTHPRTSVPAILAERGISLKCWQMTFDLVEKARVADAERVQACMKEKKDSNFYLRTSGFITGLVSLPITISLVDTFADSNLPILLCILSILGIIVLVWAFSFGIISSIVNKKPLRDNLLWQQIRDDQNRIYLEKGNVQVSWHGIYLEATNTQINFGLKFEPLDDQGKPLPATDDEIHAEPIFVEKDAIVVGDAIAVQDSEKSEKTSLLLEMV